MAAKRSVDLAALVSRLPASSQVNGDTQRLITSLEIDSRRVKPGALFVALPGTQTDGHDYVAAAIAKGALAVVVEAARAPRVPPHVTVIHVPDSRRAVSALAAAFYGDPSKALATVGVTGTNGKTTTTRMIAAILDGAGKPCGVVGTVGAEFRDRTWQLANTTPLPPELHALLAEMLELGAVAVAMEVSSHALALGRVDDVNFRATALTNVTRDHLDFHETIDAYAAAKRQLFGMAPACALNADDEYGSRWTTDLSARGVAVTTYGEAPGADLSPTEIEIAPSGSRFVLDGRRFELRVPGRFNVWNALAAIAVARILGVDDAASAAGLASLERVPGRMEHLSGGGIDVVVDYAHTPDALEHALSALRETCTRRLAVVFGCGGDRDRGKRPEMGAIAARLADRVYVTSDNPRSEDPQAIADDVVAGMTARPYAVELDRCKAIERAVADAEPGDVVLVAGKGHEGYQILGDRIVDFDDLTVVRETLGARVSAT